MIWNKRLRKKSGELRKSLRTWQIPKDVRDRWGLKDGDRLELLIDVAGQKSSAEVVLTSGGEYSLSKDIGQEIQSALERHNLNEITFGFETPTTLEAVEMDFQARVGAASKQTDEFLTEQLSNAPPFPAKKQALVYIYERSPYVVEAVLRRAAGKCERCGRFAPFARKSNGTPYLEVHHAVPLSQGGHDTIENGLALCPNCHRQMHFGNV